MATEAHRPVLFNKLMQRGIYHTVAIKNPSLTVDYAVMRRFEYGSMVLTLYTAMRYLLRLR